jgi:hypothetical protein
LGKQNCAKNYEGPSPAEGQVSACLPVAGMTFVSSLFKFFRHYARVILNNVKELRFGKAKLC